MLAHFRAKCSFPLLYTCPLKVKRGTVILFAVIGTGLIAYLASAKRFLDTYKVKFLDAKFDFARTAQSKFLKLIFFIRINVANDTDFAGTLNSAKLEVYYGKKKLGFVDLKNAVTIKAGATTVVEIPCNVDTLNVINSLQGMFQLVSSGKSLVFHVKGPLNFNAGTYTVDQDFKVPLLKQ